MKSQITKVLEPLKGFDISLQTEALMFLNLLIEKNFNPCPSESLYEDILPSELFELTLGPPDKTEILQALGELLSSDKLPFSLQASILSLLGVTYDLVSIRIILAYVRHRSRAFSDQTLYAISVSLGKLLSWGKSSTDASTIADLVREADVLAILDSELGGRDSNITHPLTRLLTEMRRLLK